MLSYENSGFSLDASVKIYSCDRSGLERLVRYCARPLKKRYMKLSYQKLLN